MLKKGLAVLLAAGLLLTAPVCPAAAEEFAPDAKAALVMEAGAGTVLYGKNIHRELPVASTTKIMTALLTLEERDLWEEFTVPAAAVGTEGSSMGLKKGDRVTLWALAAGMLLSSGNDAANAAALRISGSLPAFAKRMNRRAALLGMNHTHFKNPSGLDEPGHISSAFDLALLARAALKNPLFYELCSSKYETVSFGRPPAEYRLRNHNKLLTLYPAAVGVKTGFTRKAGRCLVSAAEQDGVRLIVVTLGCADDWTAHEKLYERYFALTERRAIPWEDLFFPVAGGERASVRVRRQCPLFYTAIKGKEGELTARVYGRNFYYAPVKKGDILGEIVYYNGERAVGEANLLAAGTVEAKGPRRPRLFSSRAGFYK